MRLFLAVDLSKKITHELERQIEPVQKEYPQFEWVPAQNLHLTIHFFGDVENVEHLQKRLEEQLFDQESFHLYSYGIDLFINHRNRKIIVYLNFRREKKLESIADRVNEFFATSSVHTQRYIPHLTLARSRIPSKQQYFVLKKRMNKLQVDVSFHVQKLVLFQSILEGRTPVYKIIKEFSLI